MHRAFLILWSNLNFIIKQISLQKVAQTPVLITTYVSRFFGEHINQGKLVAMDGPIPLMQRSSWYISTTSQKISDRNLLCFAIDKSEGFLYS